MPDDRFFGSLQETKREETLDVPGIKASDTRWKRIDLLKERAGLGARS